MQDTDKTLTQVKDYPANMSVSLAVSALQKAIRRGNAEMASRAASFLVEIAPDRLWRRLVVIGLEDVGIGDLSVVEDVLWVSGKTAWRRKNGGDERIALDLIRSLCATPKSREACDLLVIADLHPAFAEARSSFRRLRGHELAGILLDEQQPLPVRTIAAWYLAGTKRYPAVYLPPRDGRFVDLLDLYRGMGASEEVLKVAAMGSTRTQEAHAVTLPLIAVAAAKSAENRIVTEPFAGLGEIGSWPSEALDMHTRAGKAAIRIFIAECETLHEYLLEFIPASELEEVVGALVFRIEGACVDRRLVHQCSAAILARADEAQICWGSLPTTRAREALALTREYLPTLHQARRLVMSRT